MLIPDSQEYSRFLGKVLIKAIDLLCDRLNNERKQIFDAISTIRVQSVPDPTESAWPYSTVPDPTESAWPYRECLTLQRVPDPIVQFMPGRLQLVFDLNGT